MLDSWIQKVAVLMDLEREVTDIIKESESPMITRIGIYAGQVLLCLEAHQGQMSMDALLREIDVPQRCC